MSDKQIELIRFFQDQLTLWEQSSNLFDPEAWLQIDDQIAKIEDLRPEERTELNATVTRVLSFLRRHG